MYLLLNDSDGYTVKESGDRGLAVFVVMLAEFCVDLILCLRFVFACFLLIPLFVEVYFPTTLVTVVFVPRVLLFSMCGVL